MRLSKRYAPVSLRGVRHPGRRGNLFVTKIKSEIPTPSKACRARNDGLEKIIVSACLCGLYCRYDGEHWPIHPKIKNLSGVIPVCPEQLGGLPTPRPSSKIVFDGRRTMVIDKNGRDVTKYFVKGTKKVVEYALKNKVKKAYLKTKSPSCGRDGITARELKKLGITIIWVN